MLGSSLSRFAYRGCVPETGDKWAQWVLERSHGGDPDQKREWLARLETYREAVLRRARPNAGEALLDVGTGDGLIAFGALPLVGDDGRVTAQTPPEPGRGGRDVPRLTNLRTAR